MLLPNNPSPSSALSARQQTAIVDVVRIAGARVLVLSKQEIAAETKPDGSPVTRADIVSQAILVSHPLSSFTKDVQIWFRLFLPGGSESAALSEIKRGFRD